MGKRVALVIVFTAMVVFLFVNNYLVWRNNANFRASAIKKQLSNTRTEVAVTNTSATETLQTQPKFQNVSKQEKISSAGYVRHVDLQQKLAGKLKILREETKQQAAASKSKGIVLALICVKKCGSGFMKLIVRHHQAIHLIENQAPNGCMDIPTLRNAIREAKQKYPNKVIAISHHSCTTAPETFNKMGDEKPDKLLFLLCNPVRRAFSDFHNFIFQRWFESLQNRSFSQIVEHSITQLTAAAEKPIYQRDERTFGKYLDELRFDSIKFDQTIVSRGIYAYDLTQFLASYSRKHVLFVTGKELIQNPAKVMLKIQKFVNLTVTMDGSNFVFNKQTGFYCPKVNGQRYCLRALKSRTTGEGKPTPDPISVKKLKAFYKPYNEKLTELLGHKIRW